MNNIAQALGLGQPIGTTQTPHSATDRGMDDDEHGAGTGTGVAGGGTRAGTNADVYQSGGTDRSNSRDGFSAGLSGDHTSGGIPHHAGQTPIADKFTGHGAPSQDAVSGAYAGSGTSHGLTGESHADSHFSNTSALTGNEHSTSHSGSGLAAGGLASRSPPSQEGVSGSYAGSGTSHGLTGESHAESQSYGHSHANSQSHGHSHSGLAAGAGAGAIGAGTGAAALSHSSHSTGDRNVGSGNALTGGFDSVAGREGSDKPGKIIGERGNESGLNAGNYASSGTGAGISSSGQDLKHGSHGLGAAGVGAGAGAGAAAYGASQTGSHSQSGVGHDSHTSTKRHDDVKQTPRGQPISNPDDLDSGTRHGLVWQESTGKYVHRHELEDENRSRKV